MSFDPLSIQPPEKEFIATIHRYAQQVGSMEGRQYLVIENDQLAISPDEGRAARIAELNKFVTQRVEGLNDHERNAVLADFEKIKSQMRWTNSVNASKQTTVEDIKQSSDIVNQIVKFSGLGERGASSVNKTWKAEFDREISSFKSTLMGADFWKSKGIDVGEEPPLLGDWFEQLTGPATIDPQKKIKRENIVVMIPKTMNGKPTTLENFILIMDKLMKKSGQDFKLDVWDQVLKKHGTTPITESFWLVMTPKVLPDTCGKIYAEQVEIARNYGYSEPDLLPTLIGICADYLKTGTIKLGELERGIGITQWKAPIKTRCKQTDHGGSNVGIGLVSNTLSVSIDSFPADYIGLVGQRIISKQSSALNSRNDARMDESK